MAEIKARITLDSSQFKRAFADIRKAVAASTKDLHGFGKAGLLAGQGLGAGALALGAVLVGRNAKAFAAVREASVRLGVAVAGIGVAIGRTGAAFGNLFKTGNIKGVFASLGGVASSAVKSLGASLNYIAVVAKGVAARVGASLLSIAQTAAKGALAVAAAVGLAGGLIFKGISSALSAGAELDQLAARTGAPKKDLIILGQAFKDVGLASEQVGPAINKLQKSLTGINAEGEPTNKMFARLGLDMEALKALSPTEQFKAVGKAIAGLADPAERTAAAMAIFGKSGGELNQLFANPQAIQNAQKELGNQADMLAKNSARFEKVHNALANIGVKIRGFFVGVAEALLPKLEALADFLMNLDLSGIGKKLGDGISSGLNILVNAFKQGKFGELLSLSLKAGLAVAGDYLIGVFQTAINILAEGLGLVFSGDFWTALIQGFLGVSLKVAAFFMKAFEEPIISGAALLEIAFESAIKVLWVLWDFFKGIANFFVASIKTGVQAIIALLPKRLQPKDFQKKSFDENLKEAQRNNPKTNESFHVSSIDEALANARQSVPELSKGVNQAADEALHKAGAALGNLGSKVADIISRNAAQFKVGDFFGHQELEKQLAALAKALNVPIEAVRKTAEKVKLAAGDELQLPDAKEKKGHLHHGPEADQFARIGLFASAQGATATLNHQQRIASNTGKMVGLLMKLTGGFKAPEFARAG